MKLIKNIAFLLVLGVSSIANAQSNIEDAVHLVAEVSDNDLALGESKEVTYKLYVSQNIGVTNWKELEKPNYKGFESEAIDVTPIKVHNEVYKGENYRSVVLSKVKLKSMTKGAFELETLNLNVTLEIPSDKRDNFGSRVMKTVNKNLINKPITIVVK